ncbi:type IV pilus biogenesis protein PilM [Acerihabitans sp. TG2]|uniref:type IV pilus biogenesis protein PilM n=1 Tax=Acerihabitans sp. TG2 TaxID=3096008 RepID=UPI002B23C4C3|nr:type IV pilus biogenesis protein PilM [Acerihabitans sp. TG2]MEA9392196.1 type IV pilus biogenesis protein PilM [Acerihabitans sp. TG2]
MTPGQVITAIAFLILIVTASGRNKLFNDEQNINVIGQIDSLANQMASYRGYVSSYSRTNPAKSGAATDSELNVPQWFSGRDVRIRNYLSGGRGFVYCTGGCPGGLEGRLRELTDNSLNVGHSSNGQFNVKGQNVTGVTLPSVIQNGDVVYVSVN